MINFLAAVLVPSTATVDTIDTYLTGPMRILSPWPVDRYRLGGEFTGAWDPAYEPATDPANWRLCTACAVTGQIAGRPCQQCGDAPQQGRPLGTIVADFDQWAAHPGDLVPLTTLLDPSWRLPTDYRRPSTPADQVRHYGASPDLWIDGTGMQWLSVDRTDDGAVTGDLPYDLQDILRRLLSGARVPQPNHNGAFDPAAWQVAIVAGHIAPDDAGADLPIVGSVVAITDPDYAEDDAAPDQLYVVAEDVDRPYYLLVRLGGGHGPQVPACALTEVDPARIRLAAVPDGTPSYRPSQRHEPR
ncbi:hypothetical protein [Phytohabitans aurantiacus]|uniref:DUF35 domain-containing protein n=1 Tax=Phytohabitans aurantiacus TaxID=3016789 RepID=A0ABQ5R1J6_9ACTN|nr:hypothetical protein [Phytohabitans aurantiacus]GLI00664.1 hypothetical protein Pa4123_59400 [Phytohabitans aurantiacus]